MNMKPQENTGREPVGQDKGRGYTMIEITLAVGLIAIVAAMAIPSMQRTRGTALESGAIEGLKQVAEAEEMYYDVYGYYTAGHDQWHDLRTVDAIDAKAWNRLSGRRGYFIKGYSLQLINLGTYPQNYSIVAWPRETGMELKTFFIIGDGIVRDTSQMEPINIY
jgi:prepilin-type N-terminal cleavage/methylation domain-containing protein